MTEFVKALNFFYLENPPLYDIEDSWKGFDWLVVDDKFNNLLAFNRYSESGEQITAVLNFSGVDLFTYGIGIEKGEYRVVFNTDLKKFGGEGKLKMRVFKTVNQSSQGKKNSIFIDIPKLTCIYLKKYK